MAIEYGDGSDSNSGRIIQVVETKTDALNLTMNGTAQELTMISTSITPTAASSRILCMFHGQGGWSGDGQGTAPVWMTQGTRRLASSRTGTADTCITTMSNSRGYSASDQMGNCSFTYLDHPNTTSQITYAVLIAVRNDGSGAWRMNNTWGGSSNNAGYMAPGITILTLMEVAFP